MQIKENDELVGSSTQGQSHNYDSPANSPKNSQQELYAHIKDNRRYETTAKPDKKYTIISPRNENTSRTRIENVLEVYQQVPIPTPNFIFSDLQEKRL